MASQAERTDIEAVDIFFGQPMALPAQTEAACVWGEKKSASDSAAIVVAKKKQRERKKSPVA